MRGRPSGVYRGKVDRVDGNRAWVRIPRLAGARVYGPCDVYQSPGGLTDDETGTTSGHTHTLAVAPLEAEDDVLVAFLEGRAEEIAVIGVRR